MTNLRRLQAATEGRQLHWKSKTGDRVLMGRQQPRHSISDRYIGAVPCPDIHPCTGFQRCYISTIPTRTCRQVTLRFRDHPRTAPNSGRSQGRIKSLPAEPMSSAPPLHSPPPPFLHSLPPSLPCPFPSLTSLPYPSPPSFPPLSP